MRVADTHGCSSCGCVVERNAGNFKSISADGLPRIQCSERSLEDSMMMRSPALHTIRVNGSMRATLVELVDLNLSSHDMMCVNQKLDGMIACI